MNIYIDLINRQAITSPTDSTPAIRPDFRVPATYPINLYFMRSSGNGNYNYVRFANSVIVVGVRSAAPVEVARFTLSFRGAESGVIDTRFSLSEIREILEALPTVGKGNVSVAIQTGSLTVEFIGALAGSVLPTMTARVVSSTPTGAELGIEVLPAPVTTSATVSTNVPANSRQHLTLRRPALAQTSTWTEVTPGSTPGWSGVLDTTAVPISAWETPVGDISLEVVLTALTVREGTDGATVNDGLGRSGVDGQITTSPGASGSARVSDNGTDSFLIAADGGGVYGRKFMVGDMGREVTNPDGYVYQYTTIAEVIDDGFNNMARLSQRFTDEGIGLGDAINYTLSALPSDVYYSATANFTAADVGHVISGTNIPTGTRIIAFINTQYVRISQPATAINVALSWSIASEISNVFTSALGLFQPGDVGAKIRALSVLDSDATITRYISATQVELDRRPYASATGVTWKVIPVSPYPPAMVSRLITGSASAQEVQKIALAQAATGGKLTIQDGYGGSMPLVEVINPVKTSDLQIELNRAYTNFGSCQIEEVVAGAEWNVIFGKKGAQRLLLVSEAEATYGGALLNWILADASKAPGTSASGESVTVGATSVGAVGATMGGVGPSTRVTTPALPTVVKVFTRNGLKYIGADPANVGALYQVGLDRISRITDGTKALMLRRRVMMFTDQYASFGMNQTMSSHGSTFYFIGEEGGQDRNGVYTVDLVGVTKPDDRTERHNQQRTIMFPLYQRRGTVMIDVQLVSTSVSTYVDVLFTYWLGGNHPLPADGPIAVVVHYSTVGGVEFTPTLWIRNPGFDPNTGNWGVKANQSWSRRRWMGEIWEQKVFYN